MSIVNIPKSIQDQHYRYKREVLQVKIEGQGNGKKTVIVNMENVADQLKIPAEYAIKYFGLELAASTKVKNDRAIINGEYDQNRVEAVLENFIAKFILCQKCNLPELDYKVKSNKQPITTCCRACGHLGQIDTTEKLYNTIVKNPPKSTKGFKATPPVKEEKKEKTSTTTTTPTGQITNEKAAIDDGTWSLDTSQEAIKKRREMEGLSEKFRELTKGIEEEDEEEDQEVSPVAILKQFVELKQEATANQIFQVIRKLKNDYNLTDFDCICLLYEAFLTPENVLSEIEKRAPLFRSFLSTKGQKIILGYTEELVGVKELKLLPNISVILYEFYRNGLLSKEVLEEWLSKKKSRFVKDSNVVAKVKEAAKPFGEWLTTH
ncbi:hypothetical protein ABK040_003453 [Willaertia magna]